MLQRSMELLQTEEAICRSILKCARAAAAARARLYAPSGRAGNDTSIASHATDV